MCRNGIDSIDDKYFQHKNFQRICIGSKNICTIVKSKGFDGLLSKVVTSAAFTFLCCTVSAVVIGISH